MMAVQEAGMAERDAIMIHRVHKCLRSTPAMAAGVSKTLWSIQDIG
jgi:hypothetical protein